MSITNTLDRVVRWVQAEICDPVKLKMPPDGDMDTRPNAEDYNYRTVTPAAFPLFVPTHDKLPLAVITSVPSVAVRIVKGADDMDDDVGRLNLEMEFSTWNPGTYGKDILIPVSEHPGQFQFLSDEEAAGKFEIYTDAWRDLWNWIDEARRKLRNTAQIDGIQIDRSVPIEFAPFATQDGIPDLYPIWIGYITFAVNYQLTEHNPGIEQFL